MEPKIVMLEETHLVGMRMKMTLNQDKTYVLWNQFMIKRKTVESLQRSSFYSVQIYDDQTTQENFTPATVFEKWAAVEKSEDSEVPEGMEQLTLKPGRYAVFIHNGPAKTFFKTMQYIYGQWLPHSGYAVDSRPQFEKMQEGYRADDENAREEVWIPIINII